MEENNEKNNETVKRTFSLEEVQKIIMYRQNDQIAKWILVIIVVFLLIVLFFLAHRIGVIGIDYDANSSILAAMNVIRVTEDDLQIEKNTQLNIFENFKFNNEKIIAPGSYGQYNFSVQNVTNNSIQYYINFEEILNENVNMKYRLKMDNIYVKGNNEEYIDIEEMDLGDVIVIKDSVTTFTLEWYWEHADEQDTYVGSLNENQYYGINLQINSRSVF